VSFEGGSERNAAKQRFSNAPSAAAMEVLPAELQQRVWQEKEAMECFDRVVQELKRMPVSHLTDQLRVLLPDFFWDPPLKTGLYEHYFILRDSGWEAPPHFQDDSGNCFVTIAYAFKQQ